MPLAVAPSNVSAVPKRRWDRQRDEMDAAVARAVRELLASFGLTQTWLGQVIGLGRSQVSELLRAEGRGFSSGEITVIERAMRADGHKLEMGIIWLTAGSLSAPAETLAGMVRQYPRLLPADRETIELVANLAEQRYHQRFSPPPGRRRRTGDPE